MAAHRPTRRRPTSTPDAPQLTIASLGALLVGVLYLALPERLSLGPRWLLLVIVAVLLSPTVVLMIGMGRTPPFRVARSLALALAGVLTAALISSLVLLITHLATLRAGDILKPAALLWGINILVFAVWYWEIDGDGPIKRRLRAHEAADFLFPQQQSSFLEQQSNPPQQQGGGKGARGAKGKWMPGFVDYLFLAFCFATALSPADTPPLTHRGKLLMMAEAVISLIIIVLLVARSVNILS